MAKGKSFLKNINKIELLTGFEEPVALIHNFYKEPHFIVDMHYEIELGIVLAGTIQRQYIDGVYDLKEGDVWMTGILEPHGTKISNPPVELLIFVIKPEFLAYTKFNIETNIDYLYPFTVPSVLRPKSNDRNRKTILSISQRMLNLLESTPYKKEWIILMLIEILLILFSEWEEKRAKSTSIVNNYIKIKNAIEYALKANKGISSKDAAKLCSMSRRNFDRVFSKAVGISFPKFFLRCRLNKIARDLVTTQAPIKFLVSKYGFTDTSHLIRLFVKHYNYTPAEHRKKFT